MDRRELYKKKSLTVQPIENRRRDVIEYRKRNKDAANFLPHRPKSVDEDVEASCKPEVKCSRLEKLLKWKAERERLIQQQNLQGKKKPPFKVGVFHPPINPLQPLQNIPEVRSTVAKGTAQKKAAATKRAEALNLGNRQASAAATSLAALHDQQDFVRITRSRTAAVKEAEKKQPTTVRKQKTVASSTLKANSQPGGSKSAIPSTSKLQTVSKPVRSSKRIASAAQSFDSQLHSGAKSFAPENYKFKAPASCKTITPLPSKKKERSFIDWPKITGVNLLPPQISPQQLLTQDISARSRRRGTLIFSAKPSEETDLNTTTGASSKTPLKERKFTPNSKLSKNISEGQSAAKEQSLKKQMPSKLNEEQEQFSKKQTPGKVEEGHSSKKKTPCDRVRKNSISRNSPRRSTHKKDLASSSILESKETLISIQSPRTRRSCTLGQRMSPEVLSGEQSRILIGSSSVRKLSTKKQDSDMVTSSLNRTLNQTSEITKCAPDIASEKTEGKWMLPCKTKLVRHPENCSSTPKSKRRQLRSSTNGKENFPCNHNAKEEAPSEVDAVGSDKIKVGRLSIHEPSPPVSTPQKLPEGMVPAQFSPYITTGRGKDRHSMRRDSLESSFSENVRRKKQVEGFQMLVDRESSRLLNLCIEWEKCVEEAPSPVQDEILGAIGQARLLTKDKFQQFRNLIKQFEDGETETIMSADDLTGFWEMILVTVENLNQRFTKLEELKGNCWEDKNPTQKEPLEKKRKAKATSLKPVNKRPVQSVSRIKALIAAERKKKELALQGENPSGQVDVPTFNGGFFMIQSPQKTGRATSVSSITPPITPKPSTRLSLLQQVLTSSAARFHTESSACRRSPSSPTVKSVGIQIHASLQGRRVSSSNDSSITPPLASTTDQPVKSILKSGSRNVTDGAQRNRVAFRKSNSPLSPLVLHSPATPGNKVVKTPGPGVTQSTTKSRRPSLIPRLISVTPSASSATPTFSPLLPSTAPADGRPSLLPVRESLIPTRLFTSGDLIDWTTPPSSKA